MNTLLEIRKQRYVRWGIVGCGDVTERKSGPAFQKVSGSELRAVTRRDRAKAEDYARRHGVPRVCADPEELIGHPEVDAVYIATPPSSHAELACAVARAGKPCYVEKPMARTAAECGEMVRVFREADLPLFVAYYRRALPLFRRVKQLIDDSSLGPLREVHYTFHNRAMHAGVPEGWRFDAEIAGGGLLWDLGSHALDLFDFWLGPLQVVEGSLHYADAAAKVESGAMLRAKGSTGVPLSASWDFTREHSQDSVRLRFERAEVGCAVFGSPEVRIYGADGEERLEVHPLPEHIQQPMITQVVGCLLNGDTPWSCGDSGWRTNQVLEKMACGRRR